MKSWGSSNSKKGIIALKPGCINEQNVRWMRTLNVCAKGLWELHGRRAMHCKTPSAGLVEQCRLARGGWHEDLVGMMRKTLMDVKSLGEAGFTFGGSAEDTRMTGLVMDMLLCLASMRSSSQCHQDGAYPFKSCVGLHGSPADKRAGLEAMERDWEVVCKTEALRFKIPELVAVLDAIAWTRSALVRATFEFFDHGPSGGFTAANMEGMQMLCAQHLRVPDTKAVEDIHERLRSIHRHNKNDIVSKEARQLHAARSRVLGAWATPHVKLSNLEVSMCPLALAIQQVAAWAWLQHWWATGLPAGKLPTAPWMSKLPPLRSYI